ncbi:MAG: hypothetical protein IT259_06285 [Saprospiraceae bacterium]|nr:hypothetical protein [Saprospiraceae bacterium]
MFERNLLFRELKGISPKIQMETPEPGWMGVFTSFFPFIPNPFEFVRKLIANNSDENKLTNFLFHLRHPELSGRELKRDDSKALKDEWVAILNTIVRPLIAWSKSSPSSAAPSTGNVSTGSIQTNLQSIQLNTSLSTVQQLTPWEIFKHRRRNDKNKKRLYNNLKKAVNDSQRTAAINDIKAYLKRNDSRFLALQQRWIQVNKSIIASRSRPDRAQALQSELEQIDLEIRAVWQQIDQMPEATFQQQSVQVTRHRVIVDGATVSLRNRIDAYSTCFPDGYDGNTSGDSDALVQSVLANSGISASRIKILGLISGFEGGFSAINTYDIAEITWGFVQWAWPSESDLVQALNIIKKQAPVAFKNRIQQYGIDVNKKTLIVTNTSGNILTGSQAVTALNSDVRQLAAFSRAGIDPDIARAQIQAAVKLEIDNPLSYLIRAVFTDGPDKKTQVSKSFPLSSLITSEYGVAVIANQTVHGGFKPVDTFLKSVFSRRRFHWPEAHIWMPQVAESLITDIAARDPGRAAKFKTNCSTTPNSFQ